ncbi:50S ribosomal protein L5 [bioreactor metagenome]|uniref:50S ribosomal protein L5 n=1 Tax=bioreactor metagenome TaxID=1076179 RepID=A0A644T6B1_9ZZZZ|nr:50S ribosomal protein L5 [Candidatus Elulimicrobiales bacterium]
MTKEIKKTEYKVKEKIASAFDQMKSEFKYKNKLQAPRLTKITISVATGRAMKQDKKKNEFVIGRLTKIVGQRPVERQAKKSIASFKTRTGDKIGVAVTLRGAKMYGFLEKLLNASLPRTKDFRGIKRTSVDEIGNITFGIKEHTIFPEIHDEELKDIFGMAVTLTTTAKTKEEATRFFEIIGVPLKKD